MSFWLLAVFCLNLCACSGVKNDCPYQDFIVVDVFDYSANYQGIQSGWFGEVVRKKFNMELNIIAPNIRVVSETH